MKNNKSIAPYIIATIILIILEPILFWVSGLIFGFFLNLFIGEFFVSTFNLVFGTALVRESIPALCGIFAVVGSFFFKKSFLKREE